GGSIIQLYRAPFLSDVPSSAMNPASGRISDKACTSFCSACLSTNETRSFKPLYSMLDLLKLSCSYFIKAPTCLHMEIVLYNILSMSSITLIFYLLQIPPETRRLPTNSLF